MSKATKEDALLYHSRGRKGKVEVIPTKPYCTQSDLSLAYTPGVAYPCLEIEKNADDAYIYTAKANLVAVISNGTAVLGLGDIGALAGKPVMEGKGLLFKVFADVDVFDIEIDEKDPGSSLRYVQRLRPRSVVLILKILRHLNALKSKPGSRRCLTYRFFMTISMARLSFRLPECSMPLTSAGRNCLTSRWWYAVPAPPPTHAYGSMWPWGSGRRTLSWLTVRAS